MNGQVTAKEIRQMKDTTLMIFGGVILTFISVLLVLTNAPLALTGLFSIGGTGLVFAGLYELIVNYK